MGWNFRKRGVQEVSSVAGKAGEIFKRLAGYTVQRITDQGMAKLTTRKSLD
jgi:hypothetical protein